MPLTIVVGAQWGDEGKGKIVDLLAADMRVVARYAGGPNAGHTVVVDDRTLVLHMIPSGVLHPDVTCVIGAGTVVDLEALLTEIAAVEALGIAVRQRLVVSAAAHIILPYHRVLEREGDLARLGTTGRGIGQAYRDKAARTGIRAGLLTEPALLGAAVRENVARLHRQAPTLPDDAPELDVARILAHLEDARRSVAPLVGDATGIVLSALERGDRVLAEGAQGTLLDIDHGTYPYVTSSNASIGGVCTGLGVPPKAIGAVLGVVKAYTTRVGEGPFPTELTGEMGNLLRDSGNEYGAVTGRPRRCGWYDAVAARYGVRINGLDALALTKLDVLDGLEKIDICTAYKCGSRTLNDFPSDLAQLAACTPVYESMPGWKAPTKGCRRYEDLPEAARKYIARLEEISGVRAGIVSTGSERDDTILRKELLRPYGLG